MSWLNRIPGTTPDHRFRNVAVAIGFVLVVPVVVATLPLLAVVAVSTNYRNAATRVSHLPGLGAGGVRAGFLAGVYVFVLWGLLLAVVTLGAAHVSDSGQSDTDTGFDGDPDLPEPSDDRSNEQQDVSDEDLLFLYETRAQRWGVDLRSADLSGSTLVVDYETTATTDEEAVEELSYLVGTYVDVVDDGLETDRLEATVIDSADDTPRATWHVESAWAEEYTEEELSEEELLALVLETIDSDVE